MEVSVLKKLKHVASNPLPHSASTGLNFGPKIPHGFPSPVILNRKKHILPKSSLTIFLQFHSTVAAHKVLINKIRLHMYQV